MERKSHLVVPITIADVEEYVRKSDEINRQRRIITMIFKAVMKQLGKGFYWDYIRRGYGDQIFKLDLTRTCHLSFWAYRQGSNKDNYFQISFHCPEKQVNTDSSEGIPSEYISLVFECLPAFIEEADKTLPNAGVVDHIKFFIGRA